MEQTDSRSPAAATIEASAEIVAQGSSVPAGAAIAKPRAFSFGDPEQVLDRRELIGMLDCWTNGRWYEPPLPMEKLARCYRMSPHHSSAIIYKRNQLLRSFEPTRWLDRRTFGELAINLLQMGNCYAERRDNLAGRPMALKNTPAIFTRRGVEPDVYWWVPGYRAETAFRAGSVFHLYEYDPAQEIYGLPEWLAALHAGLLNEEATVFRRRYYKNGSHMGFILYVNEEKFEEADAEVLEMALEQGKGVGNFKNLFLHIPAGKEKGVQVIPVGEATAKDEFLGIKNTSRDDVLAAHRVPPVLIGVVPQVTGGFGKPAEAADVFHFAEIEPLQMRFLEINDWLGVEAVRFRPYERQATAGAGENAR